MAYRLVTCPETAHLEMIDYEDTPHGMVIATCTQFRTCTETCPRTCAARLDRRGPPQVILEARSLFRQRS